MTTTIADLYVKAVEDAGRARTLDPTNAKAHYRFAKAQIGKRDFPRARLGLEEGLKHCPENEPMKALLRTLLDMGVPDRISNPFAPGMQEEMEAAKAAMLNAEATLMCAYCTHIIPGKKKVIASLGNSAQKGKLGKAQALKKAGFPQQCKMCACNPCADIDQEAIRELIDS